jgi:5-carboxymethyl-2-hydroxymuconate isomerase
MPHIHLLTSANLVENVDIPDVLQALASALCRQDTIDSRSVKAYHSLFHTWVMGSEAPSGFAHCRLELMKGRPLELRAKIADAMFHVLRQCFIASDSAKEASITLELREMDPETYRKS